MKDKKKPNLTQNFKLQNSKFEYTYLSMNEKIGVFILVQSLCIRFIMSAHWSPRQQRTLITRFTVGCSGAKALIYVRISEISDEGWCTYLRHKSRAHERRTQLSAQNDLRRGVLSDNTPPPSATGVMYAPRGISNSWKTSNPATV